MTKISLGINNCFAAKRWPKATDWAEIVASELELDTVQFSFDLLDPRAKPDLRVQLAEEVKDACRDRALTLHSTFTGLSIYCFNLLMDPRDAARLDAMDLYQNMIESSSLMGAAATGGHVGAMSQKDYQDPEIAKKRIRQLAASLNDLSRKAAARGQYLLWEAMPVGREPPSTISEAVRLHKWVNENSETRIDFCVDTGHQCSWQLLQKPSKNKADLSAYTWLRELGSITPIVHLQQTDGKGDRHWPFTNKYNRHGIIHPSKLVEAIEDSDANETFLALEIAHPFEAPEDSVLKDLRQSVQYVRDYV